MALTQKIATGHWVVHLQSPSRSVVKVEVHMSREQAQRLMQPTTEFRATTAAPAANIAEAVLNRLIQQ